VVRALNVAQFASKSKIYCVDDSVCAGLLQPDMDDVGFATKLFRTLLGYDSELWPKALGMTMHLDLSHFCTLCLIATLQKLYVFDSLRTSEDSRRKIGLLAKRLRIDPANVEYRSMVMQSETPLTLCMYFSCGVLNAMCQLIIPDPVSCSFFLVFSGAETSTALRAQMISVSCHHKRPTCGGTQQCVSLKKEHCLTRSSLTAS
jgi:hypothetical protein